MPTAGMSDQVHRPRLNLFDEGDHVGDMLTYLVVAAHTILMFREELPQRDRYDSMVPRQRPHDGLESAKIT